MLIFTSHVFFAMSACAARTILSKVSVFNQSPRSATTPPSFTTDLRPRLTKWSTSHPSTFSTPADNTCTLSELFP